MKPKYFMIPKKTWSSSENKELSSIYFDKSHKGRNVVNPLDDKDSSLSKMSRDRTMSRMIREGKGSDPGIRKESLAIEQENRNNQKQVWLQNRKSNLEHLKLEHQRSLR